MAEAGQTVNRTGDAASIRRPQQARSRARVERMLEAADDILATEGFDALTMRRLGERAHVPVGTIYQFFPDKAALIDVLARGYIAKFEALIDGLLERAKTEHWSDVTDIVFDAFVDQYLRMPGYRAIWQVRQLSPELLLADESNNERIADGLRQILVTTTQLPDTPALGRACLVAVQIGDALLQLAFRLDPSGDPEVLAQAKRVQRMILSELSDESMTRRPV